MMIGTIVLPSLMVKGKIALRKVDLKTYAKLLYQKSIDLEKRESQP